MTEIPVTTVYFNSDKSLKIERIFFDANLEESEVYNGNATLAFWGHPRLISRKEATMIATNKYTVVLSIDVRNRTTIEILVIDVPNNHYVVKNTYDETAWINLAVPVLLNQGRVEYSDITSFPKVIVVFANDPEQIF